MGMKNKEKKMAGRGKKAIFFTLDALIAMGVVFIGLSLIPSMSFNKQTTTHLNYVSQDFLNVLSELKVYELNDTYISELITAGNITHLNATILEQIGEFWAESNSDLARNFTRIATEGLVPAGYGYGVWVGEEEVYSRPNHNSTNLISSRKIISGYAKNLPIFGHTSRIYLTSIKSRTSSAMAYFGGFIGEGNITARLVLPENITSISKVYLEVIAGTDSKVYINGNYAGSFPQGSGNGSFIEPDMWEIDSSYHNLLDPGVNYVSIRFTYLDENFTGEGPNYIGGGYVKVTYVTPDRAELDIDYLANNSASKRYYFSGVDGFINIYDSLYIPGNLSSMKVYLDLNSTYSVYLKIGNTTIFSNNSNGPSKITLTESQVSSVFSSNGTSYSTLSQNTIPLRLGLLNVSRTSTPLDAVLITDISGSMDWRMDMDSSGTARACTDPNLNLLTTKRISVAKCADMDFVNTILANSGPLIGTAAYHTTNATSVWMTNNSGLLSADIYNYTAGGSTCVCCGINSAAKMLANESQKTLIGRKSAGWRYNDTNLVSDPVNWPNASYNDANWKIGTAALGNGYAGLNTVISKYEGYYYFRKKFNITSLDAINTSMVYVYSDNGADVYLNGKRIDSDIANRHNAVYWNSIASVNVSYYVVGENTIAVKLRNRKVGGVLRNPAFDLELVATNSSVFDKAKKKVMLLMTDGETNVECQEQDSSGDMDHDGSSDTAKDDAIKAACDVYNNYGITVYTVGFGLSAENTTLQYMANCTGGQYFASTNYNQLRDSYLIIANSLIQFTETQEANASGITQTNIYPTSYIEFNYTPEVSAPTYGQIPVTVEGNAFGNNISQGAIYLPSGSVLTSLTATSYSADKWTSQAYVSNNAGTSNIFNLSKYGSTYNTLGDAFNINIPVSNIRLGETNTIKVQTASAQGNLSGGSAFNRLIYSVRIDGIPGYGAVYAEKTGCNWTIRFEDGTNSSFQIPSDYNGTSECNYATANYKTDDAMDAAAYSLFRKLDFDLDGSLDVNLDENNLAVDSVTISDVPSLWGPAIVEVRLW